MGRAKYDTLSIVMFIVSSPMYYAYLSYKYFHRSIYFIDLYLFYIESNIP